MLARRSHCAIIADSVINQVQQSTNKKHGYLYQSIRANGGWDNWQLIVLETVVFNEKHELRARERHWMETLKATLNVTVPNQTYTESSIANRERRLQEKRQFNAANRERINEKSREYRASHLGQLKQKIT